MARPICFAAHLLLILSSLRASAASIPATAEVEDTSLQRAASAYLHDYGIVHPSRAMVEALQHAHYPWVDASGRHRKAVLVVVAGLPSMNQTARAQLESLSKIEARLDNGTVTTLARHTVAVGLTKAAMHLCQSMPLGQRCVQDSVEFMRDEWYTYKKPGWLAAGLAKQKVALDVVAHGFDLMLLDSDLVFFRDPMDVMRTIWQADFATLSDCVAFNYTAEQFPEIPWGYHMGILWVRANKMTTRCLRDEVLDFITRIQRGESPWEQDTLAQHMARCHKHHGAQVHLLSAENFVNLCNGGCGCITEGVKRGERGTNVVPEKDGLCPMYTMQRWFAYHMACMLDQQTKTEKMLQYAKLYSEFRGKYPNATLLI